MVLFKIENDDDGENKPRITKPSASLATIQASITMQNPIPKSPALIPAEIIAVCCAQWEKQRNKKKTATATTKMWSLAHTTQSSK